MSRFFNIFIAIAGMIVLAAFFPELTTALQTLLTDANIGDYTMFETVLGWTPVLLWGGGLGVVIFLIVKEVKASRGTARSSDRRLR
ncbi:MAG: hypothetical protein QQM50_03910 [Dehalococcoides mccartyi]|uniref:hypothetical protein n=1 Tax=Dehalococcoides TaxID=61434 RepID=UPI002737882E|nr:hypothetical protein [Dehalococcoides mccartyi]MDP4279681.1 hypothetical protein [Dehalococcoides mccartyi]